MFSDPSPLTVGLRWETESFPKISSPKNGNVQVCRENPSSLPHIKGVV